MRARFEAEGATVKEGAGLKQAAARTDRASKEYDRAAMWERVLELEAGYGNQAQRLYEQSIERGPLLRSQEENISFAREVVARGREMALEQGPDLDMRQVWVHALREGPSLTTFDAVKVALEASIVRGEFIALTRERQAGAEVIGRMLAAGQTNDQRSLDEHDRANEHAQEQERGIDRPFQSLSSKSLDQPSADGSGRAGDSFGGRGDESIISGADELVEEQELEHSIEMGFAL